MFPEMRARVAEIVENVPVISDAIRKEMDMWDFIYTTPPESL